MHATHSLPPIARCVGVRRPWLRVALLGFLLVVGATPRASAAQAVPPASPPVTVAAPAAAVPARGASPGGAFLRAVVVPGWGHASIGAYRRGAFYFVLESATGWSLAKAIERVHEARGRIRFREELLRSQYATAGVLDADTVQARLDADETLQDLTALESARRQQREDWTAIGIFLVFLSGADAYVSAHLQHFPAPIEINATPVGNGRVDLSVGVKLPR